MIGTLGYEACGAGSVPPAVAGGCRLAVFHSASWCAAHPGKGLLLFKVSESEKVYSHSWQCARNQKLSCCSSCFETIPGYC
jgi:hypothetical protein